MIILRDYQLELKERIYDAIRRGYRRILCVLPTGGGKTVTFSDIALGAMRRGNSVWILCHVDLLVGQISKALTNIGVEHGVIASGKPCNLMHVVQVCSIQTLAKRKERIPVSPSIIIIDECHHIKAANWESTVAYYKNAYVLGFTATPSRLDGKPLGSFFETMVQVADTMELMRRGFLSKAMYFDPSNRVDISSVKIRGGDYDRAELEAILDNKSIIGNAVSHYNRICPGLSSIAFCVTVAHAEHVRDDFRRAGYGWDVLDGSLNTRERLKIVDSLESGKINGISVCSIADEGFDLPCVSVGILLSATMSLVKHRQRMGRVIRPVYASGMPIDTDERRLSAIAAGPKPFAFIIDHVGNLIRHGKAEDEPEWTLDDGINRKKGQGSVCAGDRLPMRCPNPDCACIPPSFGLEKCPYCGTPFPRNGRKIEVVDGELVEVANAWGETLSGKRLAKCVKCGELHAEGVDKCPECGYDYLEAAERKAAEDKLKRKREMWKLRTVDELRKYGVEQRGMTPSNAAYWARCIIEARKRKEDGK